MYKHTALISEEQIRQRVRQLADQLSKDYSDVTLDVICVLKGALFFVADLAREMESPVRIHFLQVSSYGNASESSGKAKLHFSASVDLQDRHILLVEDILDTGITLDYLLKHLREKKPRSLKTCVLLDKPSRRRVNVTPDYYGFQIPDEFVIGYGLDYREFGRNLRYIAVLDPSEYKK